MKERKACKKIMTECTISHNARQALVEGLTGTCYPNNRMLVLNRLLLALFHFPVACGIKHGPISYMTGACLRRKFYFNCFC